MRRLRSRPVRLLDGLFEQVDLGALGGITIAYSRGEELSEQLDGVAQVGVVLSGGVDVRSSDGPDALTVSTLGPGDAFGICNIFATRPLPTTLLCRCAARVAFLTKEQFLTLLDSDPRLLRRYLVLCNEKMQFLAAKVELTGIPTCRGRLVRWLRDNAGDNGVVPLPHSKENLARLLGVSRASLFRELAALASQGAIISRETDILLLDGGLPNQTKGCDKP